jgi:Mitochondrial biogenesis AIM24
VYRSRVLLPSNAQPYPEYSSLQNCTRSQSSRVPPTLSRMNRILGVLFSFLSFFVQYLPSSGQLSGTIHYLLLVFNHVHCISICNRILRKPTRNIMTIIAAAAQRLMRRSPLAPSRLCRIRRHKPVVGLVTTIKPESSFAASTNQFRPLSSTATNQPVQALASKDGVVGFPIDFDVAAKIEGNESQIVTVALKPGQVLRAESGAMMYMTSGVTMNTTTGGGLSTGFQRMLTGQNFFISDYTYEGEPGTLGHVALGTDFPSKIVRLNIEEYGGKLVCQKGALLCASHTIDIQMEFSKNFSTGFFGGEGFVLQGA